MTTLGAPANSRAARCPRDPRGTNQLSRAATLPTRYYLEGRTLPMLLSPPTLAVARAARAGTHPGLSPSTHMFSHTHSLESTGLCDWMGTSAQITLFRDQASQKTHPRPLLHTPRQVCSPFLIPWIHMPQSLFS